MAKKNPPQIDTDGCAEFLYRFAEDFESFVKINQSLDLPNRLSYKIVCRQEPTSVERSARQAALKCFASKHPMQKKAIDTRRVNQELERIPRSNLQYWHRTDPFISDEQNGKVQLFSKILEVMQNLKESYGASPDWHESYSRVLYDAVNRILNVSTFAKTDVSDAQLSYLGQLLEARYRLGMESISKMSNEELKDRILSKDETILRRGLIKGPVKTTNTKEPNSNGGQLVSDGNQKTSDGNNALAAMFGVANLSHDRRKVERTISIKIIDEIVE